MNSSEALHQQQNLITMAGPDRRPLSEDALNRYRITHSDRDLRPLVRRLHRLSHLTAGSVEPPIGESSTSPQHAEAEAEKELVRLEVLKWKAGLERSMASVRNLNRQRESYLKRAASTAGRTEELKGALREEKTLLSHKLRERDQQLQCDEVANRILARGKTRKELDEQIALIREEIAAQQTSVAEYQSISRSRIEQWAAIGPIIERVRGWKLPIDNTPTIDEGSDKMDVDEVLPPQEASTNSKLSASATPFQPSGTSTTAPAGRSGTPPPTGRSASSSHNLPARPSASRASPGPSSAAGGASSAGVMRSNSNTGGVGGSGRALPSTLPTRPNGLRSSTTTGAPSRGSLEEGELGGEEEGEVSEERSRSSRSGRSRK